MVVVFEDVLDTLEGRGARHGSDKELREMRNTDADVVAAVRLLI